MCSLRIDENQIIEIDENDIYKFINENIIDRDSISRITNKYQEYTDFRKNENALYRKLIKMKCINDFTKHMKRH